MKNVSNQTVFGSKKMYLWTKNKTLIKISYSKEEKNSYNFCNHLHIFETHETHYPNKKTINIQIYIFLAN